MRIYCLLALVVSATSYPHVVDADDVPENVFKVVQFMPQFRAYLGESLLSATEDVVNTTTGLVLQEITPQGASFSNGAKSSGQTFDQVRADASDAVSITTCEGATSVDAKVSKVSFWEDLPAPQPNQSDPDQRALVAQGMQEVLEAMQDPPSVQTPGTLRAPREGFHGLTFEYTKGDLTETLSLLNEDADDPRSSLKIFWSASDTAVCPAANAQ